jgi:sugar (pentulose or hexulose) kinase
MSAAGCPMVDARSLGAFVGLSNFVQRGDMARAIIEGLDYQVLDILTALKKCAGIGADRLVAVGGATRNKFWMQIKRYHRADIDVPEVEEATRQPSIGIVSTTEQKRGFRLKPIKHRPMQRNLVAE